MRFLLVAVMLAGCNKTTPSPVAPVAHDLSSPAPRTPPIPLIGLDGKKVDLSSLRKQVTLIAEWGTFCPPCLDELPLIQKVYEAKKNDPDVSIIAVSVDDVDTAAGRAEVATAAKKLGLTLPVYAAADSALPSYLDGHGVISPDGGFNLSLPMLAVLLSNGRGFYETGYDPAKSARYVADHVKLIDDAKRGELPTER